MQIYAWEPQEIKHTELAETIFCKALTELCGEP